MTPTRARSFASLAVVATLASGCGRTDPQWWVDNYAPEGDDESDESGEGGETGEGGEGGEGGEAGEAGSEGGGANPLNDEPRAQRSAGGTPSERVTGR